MIKVKYHLRMEEKDQLIDVFERSFESKEEQLEWEARQKPHSFLTLKAFSATEEDTCQKN